MEWFSKRVQTKREAISMKVGIIGSGVVGSATGKGLAEKGFEVIFQDVNDSLLAKLEQQGYKVHNISNGYLTKEIDLSIIAVRTPTKPLDLSGEVDLSDIEIVTKAIATELRTKKGYHTVCYRSTMPPGTTENILVPLFEKWSGKKIHEHFGVAMNPEFLRAYNNVNDFKNPRVTVLGVSDEKTANTMLSLYGGFPGEKQVVSLTEAEMIKYANNLFNATKISFFNEIWMIAKHLGVDPEVVSGVVSISAEACWNPEYGTHGGVPYGGTCLPKDSFGLLNAMKKLDIELPLLRATIEVNERIKEIGNKAEGEDFDNRKHSSYDNY